MIRRVMSESRSIRVIIKSRKSWFKTEGGDTLTGTRPQADTSKEEREIDQLVAPRQLYGLTEDEVKIVEGKV